jgi:hypothetical protein
LLLDEIGGWWSAISVGQPMSGPSRRITVGTSISPWISPGTVVSTIRKRQSPRYRSDSPPKWARSASGSSWLPGVASTGAPSGWSSSTTRR